MLASTISATLLGVEALPVTVEANSGEKGEPRCILVGLPDATVKESMDRVSSSMSNSGYSQPRTKVTINLAPGDLKKEGASFDLPIALTLLSAIGNFEPGKLKDFVIAGELGLSGEVRKVKGALAMAMMAKAKKKAGIVLPKESAWEASLVEGISVYPVESLAEAVDFLSGKVSIPVLHKEDTPYVSSKEFDYQIDFSEIKGQLKLRRAVEVAVAGGHNLLMIGPPGSGKSMVAKRIPSILPQLKIEEYLEVLNIFSIGGLSAVLHGNGLRRPIRSPHHTISDVGLIGGGTRPGPGEISLAHNGVLFMDELPEFKRSALEVLRQPLEDGQVTISRSAGKITLPSKFMLVAAMNPCPCGYLGDESHSCKCSIPQIQKYRSKISGPLLDRIDIHIEAPAVQISELRATDKGEASCDIMQRISSCREIQSDRFKSSEFHTNAEMPEILMDEYCHLTKSDADLFGMAMERLSLSARAYGKILKVSRTIADLELSQNIEKKHILEAIQYRDLDRALH
ncbi:MAG: YifB family Mg chelatase-like AAA ATPase [Verrucomicrobiota bacterium]|nr:YifB family Mg chelatase-like AAA ATPase [Verrucomicrobiota bacterium]